MSLPAEGRSSKSLLPEGHPNAQGNHVELVTNADAKSHCASGLYCFDHQTSLARASGFPL